MISFSNYPPNISGGRPIRRRTTLLLLATVVVGLLLAGPVGGLVGRNELNNNDSTVYYRVTNSYWNRSVVSWTFGVGSDDRNNNNRIDGAERNTVLGYTTSDLQTPTGDEGIYDNWNVDVDGEPGNDDPWDFRTSNDYPELQ